MCSVLQAQFDQGRGSLKDLEAAHLEENDKWLAFLDANFARQQAQLDLLQHDRAIGQGAAIGLCGAFELNPHRRSAVSVLGIERNGGYHGQHEFSREVSRVSGKILASGVCDVCDVRDQGKKECPK